MARQRFDILEAAMAAGGQGCNTTRFVCKSFCSSLILITYTELIDGPYFHREPYHYGPFDKAVY